MASGPIRPGTRRAPRAAIPLAVCVVLAAPGGAALAQADAPGAEQLIERLRQIQGEIGTGAGEATTPSAGSLIERLRQIQGEVEAAQAPTPELSEDEVRARLQDELGVEVLEVRPVEIEGRAGYAARVMNPPGNYDAAFLVTTLLVDGDSGEVLREMRTQDESFRPGLDASGAEIRRRTWR